MLASMSYSLQNISTDVLSLREQMRRPGLKKKKSLESEKTTTSPQAEELQSCAILGNPKGSSRTKVVLPEVTQLQVLEVERKCNTVEKLARGLLQLLFTPDELSKGNCTKPIRDDINELNGERLWAIKCHVDFLYPLELEGEDREKGASRRWKQLLQKSLNPICRHLRQKQ
jgi:hypothetical protein